MRSLLVKPGEQTIYFRAIQDEDKYVIACCGTTQMVTNYIMALLQTGYSIQYIDVDLFNEASYHKGHVTTDEQLDLIAIYKKILY